MSAKIATFDAVTAAVRDLRAAGTSPTADAVIEHIGGGSKPTVLAHLRVLRKSDAPQQAELPPAVLDIVRPALAELFAAGTAAEVERSRTRTERQDKLMDEMDAQIVELAAENDSLQARITELAGACERLEADRASTEEWVTALTGELSVARDELATNRDLASTGLAEMVARVEASVLALGSVQPAGKRTDRGPAKTTQPVDGGLFQPESENND